MKSRRGYVSNSSSSSFLVPKDLGEGRVRCVKLPPEIWKKIEENHIDWDGKRYVMSPVSSEWWLTEFVSDCMEDEYKRICCINGAISYLEGNDAPYGWYDEDGESNYILFKKHGISYYVDAYDIIGDSRDGMPTIFELRDKVNEIMRVKGLNMSQKLGAIKHIFNF